MSYTLTESGNVLTETQEGVTMPADYSFAAVNDYVHGVDRYFEELQWLALGMASYIDKVTKQRDDLLAALEYHQEQTRPIQATIDLIARVKGGAA